MATGSLTRYAEMKALPKGSAAPEVLITDPGMAFAVELTQVILQHSQASHRSTTAYQPQMNGLKPVSHDAIFVAPEV